jgi:Holliday junction resolvase RusA-like endonuclease
MDETRTIEIHLPIPPKWCNPNVRCNPFGKARAVRSLRNTARVEAAGAWDDDWPPMKSASVSVTFNYHRYRKRDADNLLGTLKAAFDGIADAGVVRDDTSLRYEPVRLKNMKTIPEGVTVTIVEDPPLAQ